MGKSPRQRCRPATLRRHDHRTAGCQDIQMSDVRQSPVRVARPTPPVVEDVKAWLSRISPETIITLGVVGGAMLFVLLQLQPSLLLTNTTPAGGDTGAHVWGPDYLRHHLLPNGRITGWAPDWYDGFPAYHFYFPLPALMVVFLDLVLPYGSRSS